MANELDLGALVSTAKSVATLPARTRGSAPNPLADIILASLKEDTPKEIGPVSALREDGQNTSLLDQLASKVSSAAQVVDRQYKNHGGIKTTVRKVTSLDGKTGTVTLLAQWRDPSQSDGVAIEAPTEAAESPAEAPAEEAQTEESSGGRRSRRG